MKLHLKRLFFLSYFFIITFITIPIPSQDRELEKVSLQLKWHHQFQFAGYYVAKYKGYYREGEFRDKDDPSNDLFRKLALYEQDQDKKITKRYTITAPKMIIRSPNTNIKGGVIKGDVYVEAGRYIS